MKTKPKILPIFKFLFLLLILNGCGFDEGFDENRPLTQKAEFIYRKKDERTFYAESPLKSLKRKPYPWETTLTGHYPPVTKEYFRCKGSRLNPLRQFQNKDETLSYHDCGGFEKHSLPLRDQKEFIYPILIDLLNYLQLKTEKRVVITCGHRCPDHNSYADPSPANQYSKHMIGAEVSFYIQGMEDAPEVIVELIQEYYKNNSKYENKKEWIEFKNYLKTDTNVSTPPIFNKEIFVKLFKKKEGRNFDNRHPYPYISVQVRYDKERNEPVVYTWKEANQNFLRK